MVERELLADIWIENHRKLVSSVRFTDCTQTHQVRKRSTSTTKLQWFFLSMKSWKLHIKENKKTGTKWASADIGIEASQLLTGSLKFTKSTQTQVRKRSHQLEEFLQHEYLILPYSGDKKLVQNEILQTLISNSRNYRFPQIHRITQTQVRKWPRQLEEFFIHEVSKTPHWRGLKIGTKWNPA